MNRRKRAREHRRRVPVHHGDQGGNVMAAGKSSRINRQYKTKYRIRNWREYERGLRSRGDASLKADIAGLDGAASLVETTSAGYGEGKMAAPSRDWSQMRIGAAPPDVLEALRISAH